MQHLVTMCKSRAIALARRSLRADFNPETSDQRSGRRARPLQETPQGKASHGQVHRDTAFIELWTEHARKQAETLTEQSKQLAALAQKVTRATAEPLKTGPANPFKHAA